MNISATLIGQLIFVLKLVTGAFNYYLGCRKTQTPVLAALPGVVLAIIPPFALLYLLVLLFKRDLASASTPVSG